MSIAFKFNFRWILVLLLIAQFGFSQSVIGKWKTIDDISGKEKGIVEIFERSGVFYARIVEIFESEHRNKKCKLCSGEDKDNPLLGLIIIRGLRKEGDEYNGGKIVDPKIGKYYKCYIKLEDKDKLKVRGYIGFPLLGRTQYWYRVKKQNT